MSDSLYAKLQSYALEKQDVVALCSNEEQTKLSLINPYLELLGFDVTNPRQVRVEYETGIGKGVERVDYAILERESPVVFVEAKSTKVNLRTRTPSDQLRRYAIDVLSVQFVSVTNGIEWEWYYKDNNNRLAPRPFLVVEALQPRKADARWLAKLSSSALNRETMEAARGEYLTTQFTEWFEKIQEAPSDDFLKLIYKEIDRESRRPQLDTLRNHWMRACRQAKESWVRDRLEEARRLSDDTSTEIAPTDASSIESERGARSCLIRFPDGEVKRFANGTDLQLFIVEFCAKRHLDGEDAYLRSIARPLPPKHSHKAIIGPHEEIGVERRRRLYSGNSYKGYRVFNNLNNSAKATLIQSLLSLCALPGGESPSIGKHLAIELPNSSLQIRNHPSSQRI